MRGYDIEEGTEKIREILGEGFYPEDYLNFTRKIENILSEIEERSTELERKERQLESEHKNGFTLNLYNEDFNSDNIWEDICDVVKEDHECSAMELKVISVSCNYDDE